MRAQLTPRSARSSERRNVNERFGAEFDPPGPPLRLSGIAPNQQCVVNLNRCSYSKREPIIGALVYRRAEPDRVGGVVVSAFIVTEGIAPRPSGDRGHRLGIGQDERSEGSRVDEGRRGVQDVRERKRPRALRVEVHRHRRPRRAGIVIGNGRRSRLTPFRIRGGLINGDPGELAYHLERRRSYRPISLGIQ